MKQDTFTKQLDQLIASALTEDTGDGGFAGSLGENQPGDHSTLATIPAHQQGRARLLVKDEGILAGTDVARFIFNKFDPALKFSPLLKDGDAIKPGDIAFLLEGSARSILTTERLVLNCMQRMSGIATYTSKMSRLIAGTGAKLLDTRKTTPNFRLLEKKAVEIGGGQNHRFALYDMIMLKDNHIDVAGGIVPAIVAAKKYVRKLKHPLQIEVETRSLGEVKEVLQEGGVDYIMLDNMTVEQLKEAVPLIKSKGKYKIEASGGITEESIRKIAETGVDFISVGALTHSYKSLDLSLKAIKE